MLPTQPCCSGCDLPAKFARQFTQLNSPSFEERELSDSPSFTSPCLLSFWHLSLAQLLLVRTPLCFFFSRPPSNIFSFTESILIKATESISLPMNLMQPPESFYNNSDTWYWDDNPDLRDDGTPEIEAGAIVIEPSTKFKFLI